MTKGDPEALRAALSHLLGIGGADGGNGLTFGGRGQASSAKGALENYSPAPRYVDTSHEIKDIKHGSDGWRFTAVLSTGKTDRDGESIDPEGWKFPPHTVPLFFGHAGYRDATNWIGGLSKQWIDGGKLWGDGYIPDIEENAVGRKMGKFMKLGIQIPGSVGFDPMGWTNKDGTKGSRGPGEYFDGGAIGRRYTAQGLLEHSLVPVPSNVGALVQTVKRMGSIAALEPDPDRAVVLGLRSLLGLSQESLAPSPARPYGNGDEPDPVLGALEMIETAWPEAARQVRVIRYLHQHTDKDKHFSALELGWIERWGTVSLSGGSKPA